MNTALEAGQVRRFGDYGDLYAVTGSPIKTVGEVEFVVVEVLNTGEVFDYRLADALTDPVAA